MKNNEGRGSGCPVLMKSMNDISGEPGHVPAGAGKTVSVIIALYNCEKYIEKCVASVFGQTEQNIEIIIVDDASTDSSMDKVTRLLDRCPASISVEVCQQEKNSGVSAARNRGIGMASGEYLFFLDSDDWLSEDCLETLLKAAKLHESDICSGEFEYRYDDNASESGIGTSHDLICYRGNEILEMFCQRNVQSLIACNKLISRSFVADNNLRFVEGLQHEDNLWSFSIAARAHTWVHVGAVTYYYRKNNPNSITAKEDISSRARYYFRVLSLMKEDIERLGGASADRFSFMALNMCAFEKSILWHIEAGNSANRRALYAEFRRQNVFRFGNGFYRHLNAKHKVFALGWFLPYPICRLFSPYYWANLKSRVIKQRV